MCGPPRDAAVLRAYLHAGVAGLRLGLDADVSSAVVLAIPARVVARVPALVGDDGGDGLGRVGLDEEPVQRGRGALGDGGGLVGGVGFVRVSAVDHAALRDVDAGSAAHTSAAHLRIPIGNTWVPPSCTQADILSGHRLFLLLTPPLEHFKDGNREVDQYTRPGNLLPLCLGIILGVRLRSDSWLTACTDRSGLINGPLSPLASARCPL